MIRHLQAVDYEARTKLFSGERVEHVTFNFTLENQIHRGGQYFNDKYVGTFPYHFFPALYIPCFFQEPGSSETGCVGVNAYGFSIPKE